MSQVHIDQPAPDQRQEVQDHLGPLGVEFSAVQDEPAAGLLPQAAQLGQEVHNSVGVSSARAPTTTLDGRQVDSAQATAQGCAAGFAVAEQVRQGPSDFDRVPDRMGCMINAARGRQCTGF